MNWDNEFRDRLTRAQSFSPEFALEIERRLRRMFTKELSKFERVIHGLASALGLILVGWMTAGRFNAEAGIGLRVLIGIVFLGIILPLSLIAARSAWTGTVNLRWRSKWVGRIAWYGGLALAVAQLLIVSRGPAFHNPAYIVLLGLTPLIIGGIRFLQEQGKQSELNVRQTIAELQLRMEDIAERLEREVS